MNIITKLAVRWIASRPRDQLLAAVSDIVGPDHGCVVAPRGREWHVEWVEGMDHAYASNARVGLDYTFDPPRTIFGP